jgi:hypothetical protein
MRKYYIFLSCSNIFIEGTHIQQYLKEKISKEGTSIGCIYKQSDLESSKCGIDDLTGSSIYVFNTNEAPDYMNYWEIGYAMGKGLKIIGYPGDESKQKIPEDMKNLIGPIPKDINQFVKRISLALVNLTPKDEIIKEEEWNQQPQSAKKEFEGDF